MTMRARWTDVLDRAELAIDGAPGVLLVDYDSMTGEWTPGPFKLHDGGELPADDLPECFSLNDEALAALEAIA